MAAHSFDILTPDKAAAQTHPIAFSTTLTVRLVFTSQTEHDRPAWAKSGIQLPPGVQTLGDDGAVTCALTDGRLDGRLPSTDKLAGKCIG